MCIIYIYSLSLYRSIGLTNSFVLNSPTLSGWVPGTPACNWCQARTTTKVSWPLWNHQMSMDFGMDLMDFWWILMDFDEFWWILMDFDGFWWIFAMDCRWILGVYHYSAHVKITMSLASASTRWRWIFQPWHCRDWPRRTDKNQWPSQIPGKKSPEFMP